MLVCSVLSRCIPTSVNSPFVCQNACPDEIELRVRNNSGVDDKSAGFVAAARRKRQDVMGMKHDLARSPRTRHRLELPFPPWRVDLASDVMSPSVTCTRSLFVRQRHYHNLDLSQTKGGPSSSSRYCFAMRKVPGIQARFRPCRNRLGSRPVSYPRSSEGDPGYVDCNCLALATTQCVVRKVIAERH